MKKFIIIFLVAIFMGGCSQVKTAYKVLDSNDNIESEFYIQNVEPLMITLYYIYGNQIEEEHKPALIAVYNNLHDQAITQDYVNIFPALIAVSTPILLSEVQSVELDPEERLAALTGLEVLKNYYINNNKDYPILENIYPILKNTLENNSEK